MMLSEELAIVMQVTPDTDPARCQASVCCNIDTEPSERGRRINTGTWSAFIPDIRIVVNDPLQCRHSSLGFGAHASDDDS